jgi:hypothetical protein
MSTDRQPLALVSKQAIAVVRRGLGMVDTVRFISPFTSGQGNYIVERDTLFADITLGQVVGDIQQRAAEGKGSDH